DRSKRTRRCFDRTFLSQASGPRRDGQPRHDAGLARAPLAASSCRPGPPGHRARGRIRGDAAQEHVAVHRATDRVPISLLDRCETRVARRRRSDDILIDDTLLTAHCGELTAGHEGRTANIRGWVARSRDHGQIIFIDVRDRFGITQTVFDPSVAPAAAAAAATLRPEDVVSVRGLVRRRPAGTENKKLATGEIEIAATEVAVLNRALTPPF